MQDNNLLTLCQGVQDGNIVPYIGPAALNDVVDTTNGARIPADSDSLILAMNSGKPMSPKLMYEFPRAAMNLELKKGRSHVNRFLTQTYGNTQWTRAPLHDWLATIKPHYVIDINRDTQLQQSYSDTPHTLIQGCARIGGTEYRFRLFHYDGAAYQEVEQEQVDPVLPVLFKPMGTPLPTPSYIASDADYVDYITELMGGFAIPKFLKEYRKDRQYLFLGLRLNRDTERMVMTEITRFAGQPLGWALIEEPTAKERRFCDRMNITLIESGIEELLTAARGEELEITA